MTTIRCTVQRALAASIDGSQAQLTGMRRARGDLQAQADSLREQLDSLRPLAGEGYIPRNRVLEYQRQLSQVQRDLAQNAGESARLEQVIVEARLNLQQRREEYQKEVRSQLADSFAELTDQLAQVGGPR